MKTTFAEFHSDALTTDGAVLDMRFDHVRELYGELFILLQQSLQEDPMVAGGGSLDRTIDALMESITKEMESFRKDVANARDRGTLGLALANAMPVFDSQLREVLILLTACVERRIVQLNEDRVAMQQRIKDVQFKKRGAQGYKRALGPRTHTQTSV